jgi:hypothetical protein
MIEKNIKVSEELTNEELLKIKKAIESSLYSQIDIIRAGDCIDMIVSNRTRIRDGKKNFKGVNHNG